jgi:hypothetical protein
MNASDSSKPPKIRRDGWTAERQLRFLGALASTRSVTKAARAAGMSRESAYRLRKRKEGGLFAAAWDRALEGHKLAGVSSRRCGPTGRIARANPPKVTKWTKWKDPRFNAFEKMVRYLRALELCPPVPEATPDNRACSEGRGFRAGSAPSG